MSATKPAIGTWNIGKRIAGIPVVGYGPFWEDRCDDHTSHLPKPNKKLKRATYWRYASMYPGTCSQIVQDEGAGIDFSVVQKTVGIPEIWINSKEYGWSTKLNMQGLHWRWTAIQGDERWLTIQSGLKIRFLHFDKNLRNNPPTALMKK